MSDIRFHKSHHAHKASYVLTVRQQLALPYAGRHAGRCLAALLVLLLMALASANVPALGVNPRAEELAAIVCPSRPIPEGVDAVWRQEYERRERYRQTLPRFFALMPLEADSVLLMPVRGRRVREIADTWGAPRGGGRVHEGQDIFAPTGTPVYSATSGYVYRIAENPRGGKTVTVVGGAGIRYYYAHFSAYAEGLEEGQYVTTATRLGYVGNTGNAQSTPPHLHFGMYGGSYESCAWIAQDPLPLFVDRDW